MQYDPLIEILNVAENSVEHAGKAAAIRNLQRVLREDPSLSKELQKRMALALCNVPPVPVHVGTGLATLQQQQRLRALWQD